MANIAVETPVPTDWERVRTSFMIPDGVTYLNNGTAGPCPRPVHEKTMAVTELGEANPAELGPQYTRAFQEAKPRLAAFVGALPQDMVFVLNVTLGMNMIARGLRTLRSGDEIVTTDQEYGAVTNVWEFVASRRGCTVRRVAVPQPPESPEQVVDILLGSVTARTRVLLVSHIPTTTGMIFPLERICAACRERGILTAIDGAHAPGMIPLDLAAIDADFYTGNCHKWLCAPKGTGFLHVAPRNQGLLDPLIVGWGWNKDKEETFLGNFENPGTHSPAPWIGVAEATAFQESIGREQIAARGRELAAYGRWRMAELPGITPITSADHRLSCSIMTYTLPPLEEGRLQKALERRRIAVPAGATPQGGRMRLSTHIYNTTDQLDLLAEAFREAYRI
jgi:isopenicillin-N epimerase